MRSFLERLKNAFLFERIACRLILSWSCFIISTLEEKGAYAQLGWMQNTELLTLALMVIGFFLLFSLPAVLLKKINTDALFLLLTSTYCIGYWCAYTPSANREWFMLSAIVIYALFLVYCIRALANVWDYVKMHTPVAIILATVAGLVCFGGIAILGVLRYKTFASPNFDFGIWCNMFYNMKETGLAMVTCERDTLLSHFAVHVSPVYYLLTYEYNSSNCLHIQRLKYCCKF